jgi:O-antigen ligase
MILIGYLAFAVVRFGSKYDRRLEQLLRTRTQIASIRAAHPYDFWFQLANRVAFAERLVYWYDAYRVFEDYPILGVGLGNSGFLYSETTPGYGYSLAEIRSVLSPANPDFPNPKNLWVRLLSETGVIGLASYLTWMALLFLGGWAMMIRKEGLAQVVVTAGLLSLVVQLVEGFSLDSFALPQVWIVNGMLTSVVWSGFSARQVALGGKHNSFEDVAGLSQDLSGAA